MSTLSELLPAGGGGQNQVEFTASGTLPNGKPVILKSDGTVEVVEETTTSVSESIPSGSEIVFRSIATEYVSVAFDPNNASKFILAYKDFGNGTYDGLVMMGTISGSSISFGTAVTFDNSQISMPHIAFDPNNTNKFVVAYGGYNDKLRAIVGTISGTSISFGSYAELGTAQRTVRGLTMDANTAGKFIVLYTDYGNSGYTTLVVGTISGTSISYGTPAVAYTSTTYAGGVKFDPNTAGKFVVVYMGSPSSNDYGVAKVGTVSGTSISLGTAYVFQSDDCQDMTLDFDPSTTDKFVVAYRSRPSPWHGAARVGTISGTTISFGTKVTFDTTRVQKVSMAFDAKNTNTGKLAIFYTDADNGMVGKAVVGTVSGTSISFGTPTSIYSGYLFSTALAFDPANQGRFVMAYIDRYSSRYGRIKLGQMGYTNTTTNMTTSNLLGISAEAAASGATAKIDTWGGINESQSGLTIASDYYVQGDGTLSTTSTAPAQQIGKAVSATTINMRDLT
jgi:hypothetical protein